MLLNSTIGPSYSLAGRIIRAGWLIIRSAGDMCRSKRVWVACGGFESPVRKAGIGPCWVLV